MVAHSRTTVRAHRLRPLNVPRPIQVETDDAGIPLSITRDGRRRDVHAAIETWRIDDEWWRDRIARRYVEIILDTGERSVIYEDERTGVWFEQR